MAFFAHICANLKFGFEARRPGVYEVSFYNVLDKLARFVYDAIISGSIGRVVATLIRWDFVVGKAYFSGR
jgi:hypothetical protein